MNTENSNHETQEKIQPLDLEFKKILCIIRKHIPCINNNHYLNLCRVWLEKLSECTEDKVLRNIYLTELARQIRKNKLAPPFHQPPAVGCLKTFHGNFKVPKLHKIQEESVNISATNTTPQNFDPFEDLVKPLQYKDEEFAFEYIKITDIPTKLVGHNEISPSDQNHGDSACYATENTHLTNHEGAEQVDYDTKSPDDKESHETHNNSFETPVENEDSWVDLSETSSSEYIFNHGDGEINAKNLKLRKKNGNHFLTEPEMLEMIYPKRKILKDTNYISEDWKNTIQALQLRLSDIIHQNKELKGTIKRMDMQMEENLKKYEADLSRKLKLADDHWLKEINKIKEIHAENIFDMEKSFRHKVEENNVEHEHRYDKLLEDCEKRIIEAKCEKDCVIQQKDDELKRLTDIIKQQCVRITDEITNLQNQITTCSCEEKVNLLRKCIGKMEKLFHRSEKQHLKQIDKLRQELEIKESTLQIQLKTQKAELLTKTTSERQEEFESIVNTLEVKYIQMLEMHEIQVMEMKQQSDEKIQRLVELLIKNGVHLGQIDM